MPHEGPFFGQANEPEDVLSEVEGKSLHIALLINIKISEITMLKIDSSLTNVFGYGHNNRSP